MSLRLTENKYARSFNSFSGADIFVIFEDAVVGTMTSINWSVTREKAPIYVMGHTDAVGVSMGKRAIAGSMSGMIFDRWTLYDLAWDSNPDGSSTGHRHSFATYAQKTGDIMIPGGLSYVDYSNAGYADIENADPFVAGSRIWPVQDWRSFLGWKEARVVYADQILPMDVTIAAINDAGNMAAMRLFGINILTESGGVSIDDVTMETQYTYFAFSYLPFLPQYMGGQFENRITEANMMDGIMGVFGAPGAATLQDVMQRLRETSIVSGG